MSLLNETPPAGEAKREKQGNSVKRRRPARGRILWVDDDPNLTSAACRRLRKRGYEVIPASDGMQGYWHAVTRKPDVIITDLRMPRWEGRDLLECLLSNAQTASVPVIVASGYVTPEDEMRLERMGVADVIDKPISWNRLLKLLSELTKKRSAARP